MSLTMILPGGIMVSQQDAEENPNETTELNILRFKTFNKKAKKFVNETITFKTRRCKTARQVLTMSKEAYYSMLKEPTNPKYNKIVAKSKGKPIRVWDTMSEEARIKKHCELIAKDRHAIDFFFNVLND